MTQEKPKIATNQVRIVEVPDEVTGRRVGASIEEFYIEELIGRGGVSEVYRARDTRTESTVALKFLLPERLADQQSCQRLRQEAQAIMSLRHKHIVSVLDIRENDATGPFIVMELIDGKNLTEFLPLPQKQALDICASIADALAYAHSRGMIHRDIKPSNVMLSRDGVIKLVDFGLAKAFEPENPKHIPLTRTSELVGTPLYMSPEQCFGQDLDARSDVYQLGCLLYQCLTGLPPFEGSNSFEAMFKHVSQEANYDNLPESISSVLKRAMHKNPSERFDDMSQLAMALRNTHYGNLLAKPKTTNSKGARNAKLLVGVVAGSGVLLCGALASQLVIHFIVHGFRSPTNLVAERYYQAGLYQKKLGHTEDSRRALLTAIKKDKGEIGFKALSFLRSHLPAHPVSREAEQLNIEGYNLDHSSKPVEAEKVWLDCIAQYPNFEWPYSNLASLYLRQGKTDDALRLLERAVEINPFYTNALRNLSETHLALGNREKAIEYAREAVQSDPTDQDAKDELKRLLQQ